MLKITLEIIIIGCGLFFLLGTVMGREYSRTKYHSTSNINQILPSQKGGRNILPEGK